MKFGKLSEVICDEKEGQNRRKSGKL